MMRTDKKQYIKCGNTANKLNKGEKIKCQSQIMKETITSVISD